MTQFQLYSDQNLIEALKRGETDLLGQFYLANKKEFIHWTEKYYQCDRIQALDIFQDSVIILYENIVSGKFVKTNSTLKTYLFAIAKNILLKKHRDAKRIANNPIDLENVEIGESFFDPIEEEKYEKAMQAFADTKEPCKSILKMYYYQKLSMDEIAGMLGYKSGDVVKNQKLRCIKSLREIANTMLAGK